jgi:photosystem II stability/assembly factor-like uncharacterized protein
MTPRSEPAPNQPRVVRTSSLLAVLLALALASLTASAAPAAPAAIASVSRATDGPSWSPVTTPGAGPFRGIAAVSHEVAWVGGDNGELWRTTDGGSTWQDVAPPDSTGLGFRQIVPLDRGNVVLFARGGVDDPDGPEPSLAARIFVSGDNGRTWRLSFVNQDPAAFYDCLDMFADGRHGLAVSDPVDGRFRILATADGGRSWRVRPRTGMPAAIDGEYALASGRCLQTAGPREVWFGSAFAAARIFHSTNRGETWTAVDSTIAPDTVDGAGVFALAARGREPLIAVGGGFTDIGLGTDAAAFSLNGRAWRAGGVTGGLRASVAWVAGHPGMAVSGGFNGTDITLDGGRTWTTFSSLPYGAISCADDGTCWGTGEDGTVSRLVVQP